MLRRAGYRHELLFDSTKRRELWARALTHKPDGAQFPDPFYQAEFERVILPQGCESVDDYLREADNAMYRAKSQSLGVCVLQ